MTNFVEHPDYNDGNRGPSQFWQKYKPAIADILGGNFQRGVYMADDFTGALNDENYIVSNATAGTFARVAPTDATTLAGLGRLDAASTTTAQGVQVQYGSGGSTTAVGNIIPVANTTILFECRLRFNESPTTSPPDFFAGLAEVDTSIIGSGANSTSNHIGFELINEDATLDFVAEKADNRGTQANVLTLAEDTFYKLGFVINGVSTITMYINGVATSTSSLTVSTDLPIVAMCPSFACLASGTAAAQPEVDLDWFRCLQLTLGD